MVAHRPGDTYQGSHPLSTPLHIFGRSFCRPEQTVKTADIRIQLSPDRTFSAIHYGRWDQTTESHKLLRRTLTDLCLQRPVINYVYGTMTKRLQIRSGPIARYLCASTRGNLNWQKQQQQSACDISKWNRNARTRTGKGDAR